MDIDRQLRKMYELTSIGQTIEDIRRLNLQKKDASIRGEVAKRDGIHREMLAKATELAQYALGRKFWTIDSPFAISWRDKTVVFWVAGSDVIDALVVKGFQVDGGCESDFE